MDHFLRVSYDQEGGFVAVEADRAGLDYLVEVLVRLRDDTRDDHRHLMSSEWGGESLSADPEGLGGRVLIHHLLPKRID